VLSLSVLPVMRDGRMNTRTREGLEWFGLRSVTPYSTVCWIAVEA
jgi:hypothetical protein